MEKKEKTKPNDSRHPVSKFFGSLRSWIGRWLRHGISSRLGSAALWQRHHQKLPRKKDKKALVSYSGISITFPSLKLVDGQTDNHGPWILGYSWSALELAINLPILGFHPSRNGRRRIFLVPSPAPLSSFSLFVTTSRSNLPTQNQSNWRKRFVQRYPYLPIPLLRSPLILLQRLPHLLFELFRITPHIFLAVLPWSKGRPRVNRTARFGWLRDKVGKCMRSKDCSSETKFELVLFSRADQSLRRVCTSMVTVDFHL